MELHPFQIVAPLQPNESEPLHRQIYLRFRGAISAGTLKPGTRVPSARALTKELGLSRSTIDTAYATLAAEGYIQSRGQAGTFVAIALEPRTAAQSVPPAHDLTSGLSIASGSILPFQMGLPALDAFPRKIWARLGASTIRSMQPSEMALPSIYGLPTLRAEIARYLSVSRGIGCAPAQVFVTAGYRQSLEMLCAAVLGTGDRVWIEDPGYPPTREVLKLMNASAVPVPVDNEGMIVERGIEAASDARAAIVTPAHQSPLCVSLSLQRRLALLNWAAKNDSWIVEDDYDGEYRYVSRPLPALKSLDQGGRVLYCGTFSKVLFPSIRIAYIVVPERLVARIAQISETRSSGNAHLTQAAVAAFMREGHFARHIQRTRDLYATRRAATVAGLKSVLGSRVNIDAQPGGMHLILRPKGKVSDYMLVARMRAEGLYGEALSDWGIKVTDSNGLILSFTNIDSQHMAEGLATRILAVM